MPGVELRDHLGSHAAAYAAFPSPQPALTATRTSMNPPILRHFRFKLAEIPSVPCTSCNAGAPSPSGKYRYPTSA